MSRKEVRGLGREDSPGGLGSAPQPGFLSHPLGGGGGVAWGVGCWWAGQSGQQRDFLGGLVVTTLCSQCKGHRFKSWSGTKIQHATPHVTPKWGGSQVWGLALSLCLLGPPRVETFTSENNELWKKVETLENANRWVVPPACPLAPALLQPVAGSGIALGSRREERPLSSE